MPVKIPVIQFFIVMIFQYASDRVYTPDENGMREETGAYLVEVVFVGEADLGVTRLLDSRRSFFIF